MFGSLAHDRRRLISAAAIAGVGVEVQVARHKGRLDRELGSVSLVRSFVTKCNRHGRRWGLKRLAVYDIADIDNFLWRRDGFVLLASFVSKYQIFLSPTILISP